MSIGSKLPQAPKLYYLPKLRKGFREYYAQLYKLPATLTGHTPLRKVECITQYLEEALTPQLSKQISQQLDRPIGLTEIEAIIKDLPQRTSPGPDRLTNAYYRTFSHLLSARMCTYFNTLASGTTPPKEALMGHITVLPKEGKDPSIPSSYRLISLLNTDIKIFAKVLANRLKLVLPTVIHTDQTSFITGREARDNSNRAIQLIHWANLQRPSAPCLLLSTDTEKAFDRVDWAYLQVVLSRLGLGNNLLRWIGSLYSSPEARVKVNGTLSNPFPVRNGTRQGCPLSPLIFALTLEPLLNMIRSNPNIKGLTVGTTEHKLSAYADYVLFYVTDPLISLPNIMSELRRFYSLSNFKINYSKSEILPLNIPPTMRSQLQASFSFTWCCSSLKYLGIHLPATIAQLYTCNFAPLLTTIKAYLTRWDGTTFSWMGRVSILKMNILPRILFYLQMIPIALPRSLFSALNGLFVKFIWQGHVPRLAVRMLQRPKSLGGLGVPSIRRYYEAVALQRILDWQHHTTTKSWGPLEKFLAGRNFSCSVVPSGKPRPFELRVAGPCPRPETMGCTKYTGAVITADIPTCTSWGLSLVHSRGTPLLFSHVDGRRGSSLWKVCT